MDDFADQVRWILDSAIDAAITMSEDGTVTGWNGHAETTFGWTREEAIGRDLSEPIMPERYRQRHKDGLKRFLETGDARIIGRTTPRFSHRSGEGAGYRDRVVGGNGEGAGGTAFQKQCSRGSPFNSR